MIRHTLAYVFRSWLISDWIVLSHKRKANNSNNNWTMCHEIYLRALRSTTHEEQEPVVISLVAFMLASDVN